MRLTASKIRYQGTRTDQQDTVNVVRLPDAAETAVLGVLADGMGGLPHGADASSFIADYVSRLAEGQWPDRRREQALTDWLREIAESADTAYGGFRASEGLERSGATLLMVLVKDDQCHYLSVGDSLIYAQDHRGQIHRVNALHSTKKGGRDVLTSAVFGEGIPEIDTGSLAVDRDGPARLLLASDGIFSLPEGDLAALLHKPDESKLRRIVDAVAALGLDNQDNLSMVLFDYG